MRLLIYDMQLTSYKFTSSKDVYSVYHFCYMIIQYVVFVGYSQFFYYLFVFTEHQVMKASFWCFLEVILVGSLMLYATASLLDSLLSNIHSSTS